MRDITLRTLSGKEIKLSIEDRMYIDGEFFGGDEHIEIEHPPTGDTFAEIPVASKEQVRKAVRSAKESSEEWKTLPVTERRDAVVRIADAIERSADQITKIDVADNGSCISRMQNDARNAAQKIRYFAGLATELKGEQIPTDDRTVDYTKREPYGVVAGIIPFNHPAMFAAGKIAPALVAGNGVVLKPSEHTPLSALYIASLIDDLDVFPDGLVNVLTGGRGVGAHLVEDPSVGLISMIGSVNTGKQIMKSAATNLASVLLELGGKNPMIIFPDADIETVADGAIDAMSLQWQGQSCQSGSRLFVHEDVYDEVVTRVVSGFEEISVGDPFDNSTTMGAIVSKSQYENVLQHIERAKEEGAVLLTGGEAVPDYDGYFVEPTIFEVESDMEIANTEIFGPVLSILSWREYEEMIDIANSVNYGLTASVWTDDLRTAHRTADRLEAGYVWVNDHGGTAIGAPFGGFKESGIGKGGSLEELLAQTRIKNVEINLEGPLSGLEN